MSPQQRKAHKILNALKKGKSVTFIVIQYGVDSDVVEELQARLDSLAGNAKPPAKFYLPNNSCCITYHGRELETNVSPIYNGGNPHASNWLDIERKALMCNTKAFSSMWKVKARMFIQLSEYFLRTPQALMAEWYRIKNNPAEQARLDNLYNKR
jgi:hypothetical protein